LNNNVGTPLDIPVFNQSQSSFSDTFQSQSCVDLGQLSSSAEAHGSEFPLSSPTHESSVSPPRRGGMRSRTSSENQPNRHVHFATPEEVKIEENKQKKKKQKKHSTSVPGYGSTPSYSWTQNPSQITVRVPIKNINQESVNATFFDTSVDVKFSTQAPKKDYHLLLHLLHPIVPDQSRCNVNTTNLVLELIKSTTHHIEWPSLLKANP